jgi:high-affinity iron transporter
VLATFVIGLREGLEAALIVGIVAAFLRQRGRSEALRLVWLGVGVAIAICIAIATALQIWSGSLPQAQQEALETVVGAVAVVMVSYMIVWMRRHARGLKRDLEDAASSALAQGTAWALIAMAFLAVMREGLETAVFLLAAFNASGNAVTAGLGATLGIVVASAIGYGIYRGGVRLDLARFFRLTGIVLVFVAAGLVATAFHTAHEAGWIDFGQAQLLDLSAIATPGSIQAALLTGALGIQTRPTVIETTAYLLYLIPMALFVAWPGKAPERGRRGGAAHDATNAPHSDAPAVPSTVATEGGDRV